MKRLVEKSYYKVLRVPAYGALSTLRVRVVDNTYGGDLTVKCRMDGQISIFSTTVSVPRNWKTSVYDNGLATANGRLTLYAKRVLNTDGVAVYRSTWVKPSVSHAHVDGGYIATNGTICRHGETVDIARSALVIVTAAATAAAVAIEVLPYNSLCEQTQAVQDYVRKNSKVFYGMDRVGVIDSVDSINGSQIMLGMILTSNKAKRALADLLLE